tara:strand:+ start:94075 stop:95595 length:1521 start_codon:yes stop_codon:yes gene_type:complete
MAQEPKVVIIDDDKLSTHNWKILLKFISEDVMAFSAEHWARYNFEQNNDQPFLAVLIGKLMDSAFNESAFEDLVKSIHDLHPKIPILLNCDDTFIHNLPESSQPWVIQLPVNIEYLTLIRMLEYARQLSGLELKQSKSKIISEHGTPLFRTLVGDSALMTQVRELIHQVAKRNINVLLLGESGTGKEIVARNIHYHSGRGEKPFVIVNCAAQGEQFEASLFGRSRAVQLEEGAGYLEQANGGTLFLDKIEEMPLSVQARLLSFLDEKSFHRLGENEKRHADVRVVVATNSDLKQKVRSGEFREDLYYLLNVVPIEMPALREHAEDIPDLLAELITRLEHEGQKAVRLNSSAIDGLKRYHWPGNVRELTNLIERLSVIHEGKIIGLTELPVEYQVKPEDMTTEGRAGIQGVKTDQQIEGDASEIEGEITVAKAQADLKMPLEKKSFLKIMSPLTADNLALYLRNFEKELLQAALEDSAGIEKFAAQRMNIDEQVLQEKLQEHALIQT